jgi:FRG domain
MPTNRGGSRWTETATLHRRNGGQVDRMTAGRTAMNENGNQGRTTEFGLSCWEEFEEKASAFDDPNRKLWDEVWFRGQADAQWALLTTLERRSKRVSTVSMYLNLISELKPAIETFTGAEFQMPKRSEIEERCRQYDLFHWFLLDAVTYMAHLRHGAFPSPLLDWTGSPYVAAYFAFSRAGRQNAGEVAIYAYRERPNNMKIEGSDSPTILSFGPLIKTHNRHFRQQSRYTMCLRFENGEWIFTPHDSVYGAKDDRQQDLLWKMTIPVTERQKALRHFDKFNLNEFTLFASEEGLLEMLAMRVIDMRG